MTTKWYIGDLLQFKHTFLGWSLINHYIRNREVTTAVDILMVDNYKKILGMHCDKKIDYIYYD